MNKEEQLKLELYLYNECKERYKIIQARFYGFPVFPNPFLKGLKEMEESIKRLQEKINGRG